MSGNRAPLKDRVAELEALVEKLKEDRDIPDPILESKGLFFAQVIAGVIANDGSRAMSETSLQRLVSNAERLWNVYVQIVRGDQIKLWEQRLVEEKQKREAMQKALDAAKATIAAQTETIRSLDGLDDDNEVLEEAPEEEASPEEVEGALDAPKDDPAE